MKSTYVSRVDRDHPSCLIFLVDQSNSMNDPMAGSKQPKHLAVAGILNGLLYELILRSVKSHAEGPRPYFAVAVVGYSTNEDGDPVISNGLHPPLDAHPVVWTPDLAAHPLRVEQRPAPSGTGQVSAPVWIEPYAAGGTPMCAAFDRAGRIAKSWVDAYPRSFPPIVVNLTDGEATDGDPGPWAERIRALSNDDGAVLLFNLSISNDSTAPLLFPSSSDRLVDRPARKLFEMSSELPAFMLDAARAQGHQVDAGARGFGFNADIRSVMTFLNVGTAVGKVLR